MRQGTHIHVLRYPSERRVPVLGANVAVHVPAREVLLGHSTVLEVGQGGKVRLDAHQGLVRSLAAGRGGRPDGVGPTTLRRELEAF